MYALKEIGLGLLFFAMLYLVALTLWRYIFKKYISLRLFHIIFFVKLSASIAYGFIYTFYYDGGDTVPFYNYGGIVHEMIMNNEYSSAAYFLNQESIQERHLLIDYMPKKSLYLSSGLPFFMIKIIGILSLITFDSYYSIALILAFYCFLGLLFLFKLVCDEFQLSRNQIFLSLFFIPSILIMGSGLMKDTLTLGGLCWMTYASFKMLRLKFKYGLYPLLFFISLYIVFELKPYIVYAFVPAFFLAMFHTFIKSIEKPPLKFFTLIATTILLSSFGYYIYTNHAGKIANEFIESLINNAESYQSFHSYLASTEGQSGYSLGTVEFSLLGIIMKIPAAINVAIFRPYVWEVRNIMMAYAAVESIFVLLTILYVLINVGLVKLFKFTFSNPLLLFLIVYALAFLFAVGFTSYNFGALLRYKIPGLLFFILFLELLVKLKKRHKNQINQI